jgi:hypothetical protein
MELLRWRFMERSVIIISEDAISLYRPTLPLSETLPLAVLRSTHGGVSNTVCNVGDQFPHTCTSITCNC